MLHAGHNAVIIPIVWCVYVRKQFVVSKSSFQAVSNLLLYLLFLKIDRLGAISILVHVFLYIICLKIYISDPKLPVHVSEGSNRAAQPLLYFFPRYSVFKPLSFHIVFISQVQITCFYSVMAALTKEARQTLNFKDNKVEKKELSL